MALVTSAIFAIGVKTPAASDHGEEEEELLASPGLSGQPTQESFHYSYRSDVIVQKTMTT